MTEKAVKDKAFSGIALSDTLPFGYFEDHVKLFCNM
jgi:hypothetical protein